MADGSLTVRVAAAALAVLVAGAAALAGGVVFYVGLLTGWWWLLGVLAAAAVLVPGALAVGAVAARGRPTGPAVRRLRRVALAALLVFGVAGTVLRLVA